MDCSTTLISQLPTFTSFFFFSKPAFQRNTLRGTLGGFCHWRPRQPLRSWSPFFSGIFCSFEFSRDRHCHGTRQWLHVDCHLMSSHGSRLPKTLRECVDIMATLWHTRAPQHHTRTYQHQQPAHKQSNAPQNQSRTSRSMEEGGVQDASCTSHRFRAVGTAQPTTYMPEKTEEGRAEVSRHRHVWCTLGSASSASRVRVAQEPSPSCICRRPSQTLE